ncbi:MAG: hypothetical protein AB8H03_23715 [Saprospiraceae bacterium]
MPELIEHPIQLKSTDVTQSSKTIRILLVWIDKYFDQFLEVPNFKNQKLQNISFNYLNELAIFFYALKGSISKQSADPWIVDWFDSRLAKLENHLIFFDKKIKWNELKIQVKERPDILKAFLFQPLLMNAIQHLAESNFTILHSLLDAHEFEQDEISQMDYVFLKDLFFQKESDQYFLNQLGKIYRELDGQLAKGGIVDLYDVTHLIFFGTKFGNTVLPNIEKHFPKIKNELFQAATKQITIGDYDIGAELLLSLFYIEKKITDKIFSLLKQLINAVQDEDLPIVNTRNNDRTTGGNFRAKYHPILIVTMTLISAYCLFPKMKK